MDAIDWALLFACPVCAASTGQFCQDQRGALFRPTTRAHQARRDLVQQFTEESRSAMMRALQAAS